MTPADPAHAGMTFTEQLNLLFKHVRPVPEREYMLAEVSAGTGLSVAAISHMRTGRNSNPQLNTLRMLARFFNVPLSYFDTATAEEGFALIAARHQPAPVPELNEIAFRASWLSAEAQKDMLTMIKWLQAAEYGEARGDLPPLLHLADADDA